jgi:hypothetical protein
VVGAQVTRTTLDGATGGGGLLTDSGLSRRSHRSVAFGVFVGTASAVGIAMFAGAMHLYALLQSSGFETGGVPRNLRWAWAHGDQILIASTLALPVFFLAAAILPAVLGVRVTGRRLAGVLVSLLTAVPVGSALTLAILGSLDAVDSVLANQMLIVFGIAVFALVGLLAGRFAGGSAAPAARQPRPTSAST